MKKSDIEHIEEEVDRQYWGSGRAGGKKQAYVHQGKKTQRVLGHAVAAAGRMKREEEARKEIRRITDPLEETRVSLYTEWVTTSLRNIQHIYNKGDIERHTYTSGGHGGTGRQTSRNAWDIIHKPTGIRVTSAQSRLAGQNWQWGKQELTKRLTRHLDAWKSVLPPDFKQEELPSLIADELHR